MADLRNKIFTAVTGRTADVSGKVDGDIVGMLMAVGGASSKTKSGIDLTAAAEKLDVSRRTLERWVKTAQTGTGQRPSADHAKALATKARQTATTKAGRKENTSALRKKLSRGARVSITAQQGPVFGGKDYFRKREVGLDLDPEQAAAMMDAYEAGGEKGFMSWATEFWGADYSPSGEWVFGDVSDIEITGPGGGH